MQTFQIAPANVTMPWLLLPIVMIPIVVVVVVSIAVMTGMKARFNVSSAGLTINGDFYGRTIPASALRGGSARRVDIAGDSELRPVRRTMGTGLPGYRSGWFRLQNGEKALFMSRILPKPFTYRRAMALR
jgi:hypothetical protein